MSAHLFRRLLAARLSHVAKAPLALSLLALSACEGGAEKRLECIDWDTQLGACLDREEALEELRLSEGCQNVHHSVDSDAVEKDGQCCYEVTVTDECCYGSGCAVPGRPLVVEGEMVVAPAVRGEKGWSADPSLSTRAARRGGAAVDPSLSTPRSAAALPAAPSLSTPVPAPAAAERALLAGMWLRAARLEHASVASFARFSLELLAFGAPPALVAAAHTAALDEIGHAEACFALASRYGGEPVGPGALPLPAALPRAAGLAELAAATVEEGCVGETMAALFAAEQRSCASDPRVCAALEAVALEEARHAELAWTTLRWALAEGGEPVRRAAEAAFRRAVERARGASDEELPAGVRPEVVSAHGLLAPSVFSSVSEQAITGVILPCARGMGLLV